MRGRSMPMAVVTAGEAGSAGSHSSWTARIVLVAIVVAAVAAFTVLQLRARRPLAARRPRVTGRRRSREVYDWRTLPPGYDNDQPGDQLGDQPGDETSFSGQFSYGPLWRYGAPQGRGRDYDPDEDRARGFGYGRDADRDHGARADVRAPWIVPQDAPRDRRS